MREALNDRDNGGVECREVAVVMLQRASVSCRRVRIQQQRLRAKYCTFAF